jgi:hypothetical protein
MKTLKTIFLAAGLVIFPLSLAASDPMKPQTIYPVGPALRNLIDYQINKLDRASPLTEDQKKAIRTFLEDEATKLDAIQRGNRGELTQILREGLPVICGTSANILKTLTEAQRQAGGVALVDERREGFLNTFQLRLTDMVMRFEDAAGIPKLIGPAAGQTP